MDVLIFDLSRKKHISFRHVYFPSRTASYSDTIFALNFNNSHFTGYVTDVAVPSNGKYFVSAESDQKGIIHKLHIIPKISKILP